MSKEIKPKTQPRMQWTTSYSLAPTYVFNEVEIEF